jgi:hypothetical protein
MNYIADRSTAQAILRNIVRLELNVILENLHKQAISLLKPHQEGHPITHNSEFTETLENQDGKATSTIR